MKYELSQALPILERTPKVFRTLLQDLPAAWTQQNEGGDSWSPYDVVGHLIHGEKTDWMQRVAVVLNKDENKTFTPFDRFAQFEESKGKDLSQLMDEFESLRAANLDSLRSLNLSAEQMDLKGNHPSLGVVTLSELLSTWVVHDLGHIVQVCRVMAKQYGDQVGPWTQYLTILNSQPKE